MTRNMSKESGDIMKTYMQEIGEFPLISRKEEIECAALIAAGSIEAKHKLIQANLRLVVKISHDFKGGSLSLLDLISEGNIGLIRASEKFDPEKGAKFSSYAAWWIKQGMRRALTEKSRTIRIPVATAGKIAKVKRITRELSDELGRAASLEEIAEKADVSARTVRVYQFVCWDAEYIHAPISKGEDGTYEQFLGDGGPNPFDNLESSDDGYLLRKGFETLDQRERDILIKRYGLDGTRPKTLEQTSRYIGRTRERVRQIQNHALKKIKKFIRDPPENLELLVNEGTSYEPSPHAVYGTTPIDDDETHVPLSGTLFDFCEMYDMEPEGIKEIVMPYLTNGGTKKKPLLQYEESSLDTIHRSLSAEQAMRSAAEGLNNDILVEVYDMEE